MNGCEIYCDQISDDQRMDADEESQLFSQYQQGDVRAGQKIVEAWLPLFVKIAREFHTRYNFQLEDLIQEANLGAIEALRGFDPQKGRFSTYAVWHVKRRLWKCTQLNRGLSRLPSHFANHADRKLLSPTSLALATRTQGADLTKVNVSAPPEDPHGMREYRQLFEERLPRLREREQQIMRQRLNGDTLQEIADRYGISKERVRQIFVKSAATMRQHRRPACCSG